MNDTYTIILIAHIFLILYEICYLCEEFSLIIIL